MPSHNRLRPMRGLQSIATGQRPLEGIDLAHAIRRGYLSASTASGGAGWPLSPHDRARAAADAVTRLASSLTYAA